MCLDFPKFVFDIDASRLGIVRVEWTKDSSGRWKMEEVPGSGKFFPAQLVFLALGFLGPQSQAPDALGIKQDARSNIQTPPKVRFTNIYYVFLKFMILAEIHNKCRGCLCGW